MSGTDRDKIPGQLDLSSLRQVPEAAGAYHATGVRVLPGDVSRPRYGGAMRSGASGAAGQAPHGGDFPRADFRDVQAVFRSAGIALERSSDDAQDAGVLGSLRRLASAGHLAGRVVAGDLVSHPKPEVADALRAAILRGGLPKPGTPDRARFTKLRALHRRGLLTPRLVKIPIRDAITEWRTVEAAMAELGRAYAEAMVLLHTLRSRAAADRAQYRVALDRKNSTDSLQAALRAPVTLATKVPADVGPPLRALLDVRALTSAPRPGPLAALPAAA